MRHGHIRDFDPKKGVSISTLSYDYPPGLDVPPHSHGSDQVIYAIRGVMHVSAGSSLWVIPPQFAIWIPARTIHEIRMPGPVSMRTLYMRPGVARQPPPECAVLHITPLLRELIVEAVRIGELRSNNTLHRALREVIVCGLGDSSQVQASITLPRDPRALGVARAVIERPDSRLPALCREAGVSIRTLERLFQSDVGISFDDWRRQARLMRAIELLASNATVKQTAFEIGYQQPSAFIQMFRKTLGVTPKAWATRYAG